MTDRLETMADGLARDWDTRAPYRRLDLADRDQAYAVAGLLQQRMVATRGPIAGRKIALSSKAMQQMVGLDAPLAGAIFANDLHTTPARIARSTFRRLGLEYELAFRLSAPAGPGEQFDPATVLDRIDAVAPAFELIEDRGADYSDLDGLTLAADNAWCGGVVLGGHIAGWRDLDLANLPSTLHQDGHDPEPGNTGAADPVDSLIWVLEHFAGRGQTIGAGEWIITGSVLRTRFPEAGDRLRYEIDGLASVEIAVV